MAIFKLSERKIVEEIESHLQTLLASGLSLGPDWHWHQDRLKGLEKVDEALIRYLKRLHKTIRDDQGLFEKNYYNLMRFRELLNRMEKKIPEEKQANAEIQRFREIIKTIVENIETEMGLAIKRFNLADNSDKDARARIKAAQDFWVGAIGAEVLKNGCLKIQDTNQASAKIKEILEKDYMGTKDAFFRTLLIMISTCPHKAGLKIKYLWGKGIAVELCLLGKVKGRKKENVQFSYRSHGDLEVYGGGGRKLADVCSWDIELHDSMKGFGVIPQSKLLKTCEEVDLGGISFYVPKLEFQFLDKFFGKESAPRHEGWDYELLARAYKLDRKIIFHEIDLFKKEEMGEIETFWDETGEKINDYFKQRFKYWMQVAERGKWKDLGYNVNEEISMKIWNDITGICGSDLQPQHIQIANGELSEESRRLIVSKLHKQYQEKKERLDQLSKQIEAALG